MNIRRRGNCLLIISDDEELLRRAESVLVPEGCVVKRIPTATFADSSFWRQCTDYPGVILLDVEGEDLDKAVTILRGIKKARVPSPIIAVTTTFSQEFGTKIVSEGICYHLLRDSIGNELREVVTSLIKPARASDT